MTHAAHTSWSPYPPISVTVPPVRRSSTAHLVIAWVLAVLTLLYLLPWAIAASRNKDDVVAIALINALLGWSVVGWVAALVMACTGSAPAQVVLLYQPTVYSPPAGASEPTVVLGAKSYRADSHLEVTRPLPIYADDPQTWRRA